jgi:hypothetical protein
MAADDGAPPVQPVRPPGDGRAVQGVVALLAVAAVILIGLSVLSGPSLLGRDDGSGGDGRGGPAAGAIGPGGSGTGPIAPGASGWTPAASPGSGTPSELPMHAYPTASPSPVPTSAPPPADVAVVDRGPTPLVPSGIAVVGGRSAPDEWPTLVADNDGVLWAVGSAGVLRYEPPTGRRAVWTVANDAAFGNLSPMFLVAAREGGVWLAGGMTPALRRFDGERFVDVLETPGWVTALAEARDGTLWVGTSTGLFRRDGDTWRGIAYASEQTTVSSLLVDSRGAVWAGWLQYPTPPGTGWITRWDGSAWQRFDGDDAVPLRLPVQAIREAPDGSVWVGTAGGLARYDGTTWSTVEQPIQAVWSIAWGSDGSAWITSGDTIVRVAHETQSGWIAYAPKDGLPDANESGWIAVSVLPTEQGVFVGTGAGVRTLEDGRWVRVGPTTPTTSPAPGWVRTLLAVSRDEAWALDDHAIWHAVDGAWTTLPLPGRSVGGIDGPADLLVDAKGRLWVATSVGVSVLDDGTWTEADRQPAAALTLGPDGRVWAAGEDAAMGPQQVRAFRRLGRAWVAEQLPATDLVTWSGSLAVDRDGTVWLGSSGDWGIKPGLLRYTPARGWEKVPVRGVTPDEYIWDLAVSTDGVAWAVGSDVVPQGAGTTEAPTTPPPWWLARLTGGPGPAVLGEAHWPPYRVGVFPDGTPVVPMAGGGLATWDGHAWSTRYGGLMFDQVSVAPDGTVWVTAGGGVWILP